MRAARALPGARGRCAGGRAQVGPAPPSGRGPGSGRWRGTCCEWGVPARGVGGVAAPRLGARRRAAGSGLGAPAGRAASGLPWGRGGGRCGARGARASPEVEPGLRRSWAGGRCRAGLGPRGLRAPPAPAAPRGPGPWPLQCPRPVTRGKRRARWPLAGPAPTRTGRGSAVGGHAGPPALRPTLCCGRCCCWCPGSCHVRRGHQETPVDVSWHSAHHWPARGRPSLCQGPQALPPSGCPTQDLGLWPGPTPQSCKAQRHRGTWLHQASLPSCLLLPQIRGRVPCCKLLTRTQGHRQPLSPPSPKHLPWAPSGPLTPHRPCQPWTPTSLDHEPRGLVGSGWQCGPPRPPDPRVRRSSWSGWVGAAGGGCPYILDVFAPLWGFEG